MRAVQAVGGQYLILRTIGEGGVAIVYEAEDTLSGKRVALKRLRNEPNVDRRRRAVQLFEREFHTLSQLAHPRIVAAYDYGVDGIEPYYTMELLDGGDLGERSPLDWLTTAKIGRDVCSALSLMHSRRMVYRDLSPRNVRCTSDGTAKLIDFGAMSPMGPTRFIVGTPSTCAPEVVNLQPLDGRTDLYSLGATLYHALTGRRPYAASHFRQLPELWQERPPSPSQIRSEIPEAMSALVMDLLQLDPALRPPNAGEVMERLSAIAGRDVVELPMVSRSYLSTPMLVGRERVLDRARRRIVRASHNEGSAILVSGPSGVGRSRFLDACVFEAKVAGLTVLLADSSDAGTGAYGVVRRLVAQLLDAVPDVALAAARSGDAAALSAFVPELAERLGDDPPLDAAELGTRLQPALREWILAVSNERPLMIAVDDVNRADDPSAGWLALLSRQVRHRAVCIATTLESDLPDASPAVRMLSEKSRPVPLGLLSRAETEQLLDSMFGSVPRLQLLAHRLSNISNGSPRDVVQLAQHLVDTGHVRYHEGAWSLPERIDGDVLPASMAQARRARVDSLSAKARVLAEAMSLAPDLRFSFDELVVITDQARAELMHTVDELIAAEVVATSGSDYALGRLGARAELAESVYGDASRHLHRKLAAVLAARGTDGLRAARHLFHAGDEEIGLDTLVRFAEESVRETGASPAAYYALLRTLPRNWLALFEQGIGLCERFARPRRQAFALHLRIGGVATQACFDVSSHFSVVCKQLSRDAGLDLFGAESERVPNAARVREVLGLAAERYGKLPESERVHDPAEALQQLARTAILIVGVVGFSLDLDLLRLCPDLTSIAPLSPTLAVVQKLVEGLWARMTGRYEPARKIYQAVLERLEDTAQVGLDDTYRAAVKLALTFVLGTLEAAVGLESSLARAAVLDASRSHDINGIQVRMLYHLWQGDVREAERHKHTVERLCIERARHDALSGILLLRELAAYAMSDDLMRVKQSLDELERTGGLAKAWQPVLNYARGEYERIRGDDAAALVEFEAAMSGMDDAGSAIWPEAAGAHVRILVALGRHGEARTTGEHYSQRGEARGMGIELNYVRMPLAIAMANAGDVDGATTLADTTLEAFLSAGTTGLNLFLAYETRAKVALVAKDMDAFTNFSERAAAECPQGASAALKGRSDRLRREGQILAYSADVESGPIGLVTRTGMETAVGTDEATRPDRVAERGLRALLRSSGADEGFLYCVEGGTFTMTAKIANHELPMSVDELARNYIEAELSQDDGATGEATGSLERTSGWTQDGDSTYRPVLLSHTTADGPTITGLAVVLVPPGARFRHPTRTAADVSRRLAR
jgi:tRNA A-37 threonylcarbamoyl transferase component Bud32